MFLNKNYPIAVVVSCYTLLFLAYHPQESIASTSLSPLQTQCLSFPDVLVNGNLNNGRDNSNGRDDQKGLKVEVHLSDKNIEKVGPLNVFIITANGECAIAKINQDSVESVGEEKKVTFEFGSGVIDVNENFNACVETSNNFDFVCVLGTNSPSKVPEKVFLEAPITNQNPIVN